MFHNGMIFLFTLYSLNPILDGLFGMYGYIGRGSKVPAARKTTKTVEIEEIFFIILKAYLNGIRTQKLKSLAQKLKKWRPSQFSPISSKILEIAKIYEIC